MAKAPQEDTNENAYVLARWRTVEKQRPASGLELRRFAISAFQFSEEHRSFLLGSCFPHDLATIQRLTLAGGYPGGTVGQQIVHAEWSGVRGVGIQGENQRRTVLDDANSRVAMAVNPPLVALG